MKKSRKQSSQWEVKSSATSKLNSALKSMSLLINSLALLSHSTSCVSKWVQIFNNYRPPSTWIKCNTPNNWKKSRQSLPNPAVSAPPSMLSTRSASILSLSQPKSLKLPSKRSARKVRKTAPKKFKLTKSLRKITLSHSSPFTTTLMALSKMICSLKQILNIKLFILTMIILKTQRLRTCLRSVWLLRCVRCIRASHMGLLVLITQILRVNGIHSEV